jgi:hypothetical protein
MSRNWRSETENQSRISYTLTELIGNTAFLGCPIQEFHFKCYVINRKVKEGKISAGRPFKRWDETVTGQQV